MNNTIERIDIGVSLADAELESYYYNKDKNNLIIKIKNWEGKIIEFIFFDLVMFLDRGGNFIMDFCRNKSRTEFFQEALEKTYEKIPLNIPYKLFQFLDISDETYLEIICEDFQFKIIK